MERMSAQRSPSPQIEVKRADLWDLYQRFRQETEELCQPLAIEDYGVQSMANVSPPKWHLAHTTWFFETFVLNKWQPSYQSFHPLFHYLFNSYYETVGTVFPRPQRGLLSRPTVEEVYHYRHYVNEHIAELIQSLDETAWSEFSMRMMLGLQHEQQHQELLLTDIKHNFAINPLRPAYQATAPAVAELYVPNHEWINFSGGLFPSGHEGDDFAFDNEKPSHLVYLDDFALAAQLVTNGEYLEFMQAGGYQKPEYWLADGWTAVQQERWSAPLYWEKIDGQWWVMTLSGMQKLHLHEPVCHVSFYEADAYARWRGKRLPTEAEWERAARKEGRVSGNFRESRLLHPRMAHAGEGQIKQLFGDVWEWTASAYGPYPGYVPPAGAFGEYNGKFMCNQMVLRGGSCVSPQAHIRASYRNFFYPTDRWQFTGIRLGGRT